MSVDWNRNVATVEAHLNLYEFKELIDDMSKQVEKELVYELICNWSESELRELKQWLDETLI